MATRQGHIKPPIPRERKRDCVTFLKIVCILNSKCISCISCTIYSLYIYIIYCAIYVPHCKRYS